LMGAVLGLALNGGRQLTYRSYAQPCVAPAARLRIGAVSCWHGKL